VKTAALTEIFGQASWKLSSDCVEAHITRTGGHLGPIRFKTACGTIQPFSIAPWAKEKLSKKIPPMLRALRGDFFCLPFGGNETPLRGEKHPPHGETANANWKLEDYQSHRLHLSMRMKIRSGRVDKFIELRPGHRAVYSTHVISEMLGCMNVGHHAMLRFPATPGSGSVSTSALQFGQVLPTPFENPANGGYSSLKPGARFKCLNDVPMLDGNLADLSSYPARAGFEDLVMLSHQASPDFAWTAVAFPSDGYAYFCLKDPQVLASTILWHSNGGRYYAPWNGRHRGVLGLEEVTSYFHYGLAESIRSNPVSDGGIPTCLRLNPKHPTNIKTIMGIVPIPNGFNRVVEISRESERVILVSENGKSVSAACAHEFLKTSTPHL